MEVHHHPKVETKNFKDYLLEGLMIFIAVMLGFFAESYRERIVSREKEHHYIQGITEDLKKDITDITEALEAQQVLLNKMDSALQIPVEKIKDINIQDTFYHYFIYFYSWEKHFSQNDNTFSQLKNAGGFSVISKQNVIDAISRLYINYDRSVKFNGTYYTTYYDKLVDLSMRIMKLPALAPSTEDASFKVLLQNKEVFTTYDNQLLQQLVNLIGYEKGCLLYYMIQEKIYKDSAAELIDYLKKEYHLSERTPSEE